MTGLDMFWAAPLAIVAVIVVGLTLISAYIDVGLRGIIYTILAIVFLCWFIVGTAHSISYISEQRVHSRTIEGFGEHNEIHDIRPRNREPL